MHVIENIDMWTIPSEVHVVTTNAVVLYNGKLAMGKGAALEARTRYHGCDALFGEAIKNKGSVYGFIYLPTLRLGAFQTKIEWSDLSNLDLIRFSTDRLCEFANSIHGNIVMNFPGIGLGKLSRNMVLPIVQKLPDNVYLCTLVQ